MYMGISDKEAFSLFVHSSTALYITGNTPIVQLRAGWRTLLTVLTCRRNRFWLVMSEWAPIPPLWGVKWGDILCYCVTKIVLALTSQTGPHACLHIYSSTVYLGFRMCCDALLQPSSLLGIVFSGFWLANVFFVLEWLGLACSCVFAFSSAQIFLNCLCERDIFN